MTCQQSHLCNLLFTPNLATCPLSLVGVSLVLAPGLTSPLKLATGFIPAGVVSPLHTIT